MFQRKIVYLPFKKTRREYYLIKLDAVVGFNITSTTNWIDVEKDSVTTRISIPTGEYETPEAVLLQINRAIFKALEINVSGSIDALTRQVTFTYNNPSILIFKFSLTPTESLRLAIGFNDPALSFTFTQDSGNKFILIAPKSVFGVAGPLFQPEYTGPPIPEGEEQPDNLPELFPFRGGKITQAIVREIRRYTYDFLSASFTNPPGEDETSPGGVVVNTPYVVKEGNTQINFDPQNPLPATAITFALNQEISIIKERPVRATVTPPDFDDNPSFSGDIENIRKRQKDYFQRGPTGVSQFEKYNASGHLFFSVYGSRIRALEEVRYILYKPEKPRDVLVGTYTKYFDNGRVWKIETHINPTYSENPNATIQDSLLQGPYLEYYQNGRPRIEASFSNNFLNGPYREYYEDGLIRCQGTLVNGKLQGEYTQWDEEGNRKFRAFYVDGTLNNSYVLDYT
jgi:hypothetical protein